MERAELVTKLNKARNVTVDVLTTSAVYAGLAVLIAGVGPALAGYEAYRKLRQSKQPTSTTHTDLIPIQAAKPSADIPFATSWSKFNERETGPASITRVRLVGRAVTARKLLGREFNEAEGHAQLQGLALAEDPLKFAAIDRSSGVTEYFGVMMRPMDGKTLNQVLLSDASNKGFGLDSGDIYNDWGAIDNDTEDMRARKKRHEQLGLPWFGFDRDRLLLRFIIGRDTLPHLNLSGAEPKPMILPVMRWTNGPDGRQFIYDLPEESVYQEILDRFLRRKPDFRAHLPHIQCYNPIAGEWAIAHFSPEIRATWPSLTGYRPGSLDRGNGSTQAAVQTLVWEKDQEPFEAKGKRYEIKGVLGSEFLNRAESFIEANAILSSR